MARGGANHRDFLENPCRQLFYGIQRCEIVAQSIGGERGEPESNLGSLLRELIHLSVPK
jgi:hypothetical protein